MGQGLVEAQKDRPPSDSCSHLAAAVFKLPLFVEMAEAPEVHEAHEVL